MTPDLSRLEQSRPFRDNRDTQPFAMRLYVMDARVRDPAILVDADELRAILL